MRSLSFLLLFLLAPQGADAAGFEPGTRVLVKGRFQRKCAARVESVPAPGYVRLAFDRPGCGDAGQPYELRQLQHITFTEEARVAGATLRKGDDVVVKGFRAGACAGRVREISRSGYVAVDFDSLLCTDTEGLRKASELTRVSYVGEATLEKARFTVGQSVAVPGILEKETCRGVIRKLTDNGLAAVELRELTCADASRLWSLGDLKPVAARPARRASGESIFRAVMREIASHRKTQKKAAGRL